MFSPMKNQPNYFRPAYIHALLLHYSHNSKSSWFLEVFCLTNKKKFYSMYFRWSFLMIYPFDVQSFELFKVARIWIVSARFLGGDIISTDASLKCFSGVRIWIASARFLSGDIISIDTSFKYFSGVDVSGGALNVN